MLKLLNIEWMKIRSYRAVKVLLGLYLIPTLLLFVFWRTQQSGGNEMGNPWDTPMLWYNIGYYARWMNSFFLGLAIILFISNEFKNRTLRQSLINGLSRFELTLSKLLLIFVFGIAFLAFYTLLGVLLFAIQGGEPTGSMFQGYNNMLAMLLQAIGYMSLAALIAFLVKNPVLSILIYLFIYPLETGLRLVLGSGFDLPGWVHHYTPAKSFADLTVNPFDPTNSGAGMEGNVPEWLLLALHRSDVQEAAIASAVYIVLFSVGYFAYIRKANL